MFREIRPRSPQSLLGNGALCTLHLALHLILKVHCMFSLGKTFLLKENICFAILVKNIKKKTEIPEIDREEFPALEASTSTKNRKSIDTQSQYLLFHYPQYYIDWRVQLYRAAIILT